MMKKKFVKSTFLVLIVGILVACRQLPSAVLQDETCSPPCWNGIIPGQTSLKEMTAKLESISKVEAKSIKTISVHQHNDSVYFDFLPNTSEDGGEIYTQDSVVQAITFLPKLNKLVLSGALQKWGPPDQYISVYYSKAETPYLATSIIYTQRGIILHNIRMPFVDAPKFDNNFLIQSVCYTDPQLITSLLKNGFLDSFTDQDLLEGLKPWKGLGEIRYLTRDLWGADR